MNDTQIPGLQIQQNGDRFIAIYKGQIIAKEITESKCISCAMIEDRPSAIARISAGIF